MYIVRAPFRVSFFGGGTDFYDYYSKFGGEVLSSTIDKYCYVTLRRLPPYFSYKNQLTYSQIERFNDPSELSHPLIRAALGYLPVSGVQINYDADLPARSGLGSSSAFSVALLCGLHLLRGENFDKQELAEESIYVERELCRESGGVQDQIAAAYGGFNRISFDSSGFNVFPQNIDKKTLKRLSRNTMLLLLGYQSG